MPRADRISSCDCGAIKDKRSPMCRACRSSQPRKKKGWYMHPTLGYIIKQVYGVGMVYKHRYVVETLTQTKLPEGAVVHHIDGDRTNNDPRNLEVILSQSEHMKHHCSSDVMKERSKLGHLARWGKE